MPVCRIFSVEGEVVREFSTEELGKTAGVTVGRSGVCDVSLKNHPGVDNTVGRVHFMLDRRGTRWWLVDARSTGITKGGERVEEAPLNDGDVFRFGSCTMAVGEKTSDSGLDFFYETNVGHVERAALWDGENTVGTSPKCAITVHDGPTCSRQHACIRVKGSVVTIEDLGSYNGTRVGGKKVGKAVPVTPGDVFYLGKVKAWIDRNTAAAEYLKRNTIWTDKYFRLFLLLVVVIVLKSLKSLFF